MSKHFKENVLPLIIAAVATAIVIAGFIFPVFGKYAYLVVVLVLLFLGFYAFARFLLS